MCIIARRSGQVSVSGGSQSSLNAPPRSNAQRNHMLHVTGHSGMEEWTEMNSLSTAMRLRCIPQVTCVLVWLGPVNPVDLMRIPPAMRLGAHLVSAMITLAMLTFFH